MALLPVAVQVAPVSSLRNKPAVPALVNKRAALPGSLAKSNAGPAGSPVAAPPEILVQVTPVSVLRHTPRFASSVASFTEITIVPPRGAMPEIFKPRRVPPPSIAVQLAPPSVVRSSPAKFPPRLRKLLNRPMPATRVWFVVSVGSNSRAPMDRLSAASVC
jgi:hypothetical protein